MKGAITVNTYSINHQENEETMKFPMGFASNPKYSVSAKALFFTLAYYDQVEKRNAIPMLELREKSGVLSQQVMSKAIKELEDDGWIRVTYGGNGKGKTNTFEIFYDAMPTVLQYRRLKDGSIVTEQEYQAMLKQPKRATGFNRGKRR